VLKSKVLVVDDDDSIRAVLDYNLKEMGHDAISAARAEAGWEVFQMEAPDLVITDVRMAGMSGLDLSTCVLSSRDLWKLARHVRDEIRDGSGSNSSRPQRG
jgi:two-component system NtrC family response regulator